jgi:hypothetical protein
LKLGILAWSSGLQHARLAHAADELVGRHDHVIAGVARLQLGEQFVIGGEQAHIDVDAGGLLEVAQRRLADIGVPVVEVQLGLFAAGRLGGLALGLLAAGGEADADRRGAHGRQQRAAGAENAVGAHDLGVSP